MCQIERAFSKSAPFVVFGRGGCKAPVYMVQVGGETSPSLNKSFSTCLHQGHTDGLFIKECKNGICIERCISSTRLIEVG